MVAKLLQWDHRSYLNYFKPNMRSKIYIKKLQPNCLNCIFITAFSLGGFRALLSKDPWNLMFKESSQTGELDTFKLNVSIYMSPKFNTRVLYITVNIFNHYAHKLRANTIISVLLRWISASWLSYQVQGASMRRQESPKCHNMTNYQETLNVFLMKPYLGDILSVTLIIYFRRGK
jgi:hypothetical protein